MKYLSNIYQEFKKMPLDKKIEIIANIMLIISIIKSL